MRVKASAETLAGLAGASSNCGAYLLNLGKYQEARPFIAESIEIRRALAAEMPIRFSLELGDSLINWGKCLSSLGSTERAAEAYGEAVESTGLWGKFPRRYLT